MARQNASVDNLREDQIGFRANKLNFAPKATEVINRLPNLNQVQFPQESFQQPDRESMTANFISNLLPKAGEVVGDVVSRGQELAGTGLEKLTELAKDPRTYEVLSNVLAVGSAPYSPQLSQTYGNIASGIKESRIAKQEAEKEKAELARDLLKQDNNALKTYTIEGFRQLREGDNPNFIQEVPLPSGRKVSMFNQEAATEAGELALKGQPKAPKGYIPLDPNLEASLADIKEDTVFKQSGAVSGNFVNTDKVNEIVEKKAIDTNDLLSKQSAAKVMDEVIENLIFSPDLDNLVGKNKIGPFNFSKRFLAGLTGFSETEEDLLANLDITNSEKILTTLLQLKEKGGGSTGFGALNQKELEVIANSLASLDTKQSKEQFIKQLRRIQNKIGNNALNAQKAYGKKYVTEGIEMYESPYRDKPKQQQIQSFVPQTRTAGAEPRFITGDEIIYGNVPAQADNNVLSGGFRVRSIR